MAKKSSIPLIFILVLGILTLGLTFLTHQSARAEGNIIYVDVDATGAATGLTWSDAFTNVQDGLAAASTGYEIWVAEGVYYPDEGSGQTDNSRSSKFSLKSGVALYGGFAATETVRTQRDWDAHITVLSGDIDGNDSTDAQGVVTTTSAIAGSNAYHVLYSQLVDAAAIVDGFTVTAGSTASSSLCTGDDCGGGMLNDGNGGVSTPTVSHVTFIGNYAYSYGGGMVNENYGHAILTEVSFIRNHAGGNGGGMANINFSNPVISGTLFESNTADYGGGGVYFSNETSPMITNTVFLSNTANIGGGYNVAIEFDEYSGNHTLTDVSFIGNHVTQADEWNDTFCNGGGGMCYVGKGDLSLTRVIFENNTSQNYGGGLYLDNTGYSNMMDEVQFEGNTSVHPGGGSFYIDSDVTISNSTISNNQTTHSTFGKGGGIALDNSSLEMITTTLSGNSSLNGGGLYVDDTSAVTLTNITFGNNSASNSGGGAYFYLTSNPVVANSVFISNTAARAGGYYDFWGTNHTLTDVSFIGNSATSTTQDVSPYCNGGGGLCHIGNGELSLIRVTFENNTSQLNGGGLFLDSSGYTTTLEDVEFNGNTSVYQGGGLYNTHGNVIVSNSLFNGNEATDDISGNGGGVTLSGGSLVMSTTTLSGNSGLLGGGLYMNGGTIALTGLVFDSNSASSSGGGMYIYASTSSSVAQSTFTHNTAPYGGGLTSYSANLIHLDGVTFTQNIASGSGGGFNNQGQAVITNSRFYGNTAQYGGGLRNYQNSATSIENASFVGNRATGFGGGIYAELLDSAWFTITNATMANNTPSHLAYFGENNGSEANNTILSNCILWGSWASALQYYSDLPVLRYTDVTDGFAGTANLNVDPAFVSTPSSGSDSTWGTLDDDYGDVRLKHNSPVIDMGSDAYSTLSTDLAGNPRSMGAAVDMGSYEVETRQMAEFASETLYDFSPQVCASLWFTNTGTLPDSVTITLTHETPSAGGNGLPRRYEVNAVGGSAYQAQLSLCYEDDELATAGIDAGQEANLHAYRFAGSPTWEEYSVVDTVNNTVTANNVSQFGIWGLGIAGDRPTAITLDTLSAKNGLWEWVRWLLGIP